MNAPDDDKVLGGHPVVVLDYAFWQRLGADRGLVGRSLLLNGHPMTVVGVTGPEFYGTDLSLRPQLRVPLAMAPVLRPNPNDSTMIRRGHQWLRVMARLRPGASIEQAMAAADVVFRRGNAALLTDLPAGAPESARQRIEARRLTMRPGPQGTNRMRTSAELPLLLLGGATATLMLIACANLANLLLARGAVRQREMAVRTALGGNRWRLVRQLLVESFVLSVAAGALGLLVAVWMVGVILSFLPAGNALGSDLAPDLTVMTATLGSSFGVLALLLAAVGVYGVLAFAVARRTREIGLRMALGAEPGDVSWLIVRQLAVIVLAGLLGGAAGAWALQGVLRTMVFGVRPADPAVFAAAVVIVGATSAIAALLPARRAARLDPVAALRQ